MLGPSGSEREETKRRIANFKAVQDRMQREREDYFVKTLADARQVQRGAPSPRGGVVELLTRVRVDHYEDKSGGAR